MTLLDRKVEVSHENKRVQITYDKSPLLARNYPLHELSDPAAMESFLEYLFLPYEELLKKEGL